MMLTGLVACGLHLHSAVSALAAPIIILLHGGGAQSSDTASANCCSAERELVLGQYCMNQIEN